MNRIGVRGVPEARVRATRAVLLTIIANLAQDAEAAPEATRSPKRRRIA